MVELDLLTVTQHYLKELVSIGIRFTVLFLIRSTNYSNLESRIPRECTTAGITSLSYLTVTHFGATLIDR